MDQATQLEQGLTALGIALPLETRQKLLAYLALLQKWNKTFALTALRDPEKAVSHHLLDSLAILPYVSGDFLLDVGSGGGQPGIPLAIVRPELGVTLLDSNSKKTAFLQQAAIELGVTNIAVHCGRVEQYQPPTKFDVIVSRAFAELADFVSLSRPLLTPAGRWLAMKGVWPHEEIARLPVGTSVDAVHRLAVPGVEGERHLVVVSSVGAPHQREN